MYFFRFYNFKIHTPIPYSKPYDLSRDFQDFKIKYSLFIISNHFVIHTLKYFLNNTRYFFLFFSRQYLLSIFNSFLLIILIFWIEYIYFKY